MTKYLGRYDRPQSRWLPAAFVLLALGPADLERALTVGRGTPAERARFHARYLTPLTDATVNQIEILTEFRRVVIEAEDRIRRGDHMFSAKQARAVLEPWQGTLTIVVRLRFHPHNVLVSVPSYEVSIGPPPVAALAVRRTPVYALAAPNQQPGTASPLVGGLIETDFDVKTVAQTTREVRVILGGKELARTMIDFARID